MSSILSPSHPYLVEMQGIVKHFPGILANDQVNLDVIPGEVHAVLGENGAGKSTLMNILSGLYHPDAGEIRVEGEPRIFRSTRDAISAGIGMVHQHFSLVDVFTVAENVILGLDEGGFKLNMTEVEDRVLEMGDRYGLKVDPGAKIWQLSVGEQQRVEIIKMLYREAKLLILDEPTAVLTPQEADELAGTLIQMTESGRAVLYISHKLQEVLRVADRITVLRHGKHVATVAASEINEKELTRLMVGKDLMPLVKKADLQAPEETIFKIENLVVRGNRGNLAIQGLDLKIRKGEILGIAGVAGNGQRELAEAIVGLRQVDSGQIFLKDQLITHQSPLENIKQGISLIPENCKEMGLMPSLNLFDNAILKKYRKSPISKGIFLDETQIEEYGNQLIRDFSIQLAGPEEPVWKLSGGNMQKLLLGREITNNPEILIAANPTRGLDIQAAMEIRRLLLDQRQAGAAILLISEDLDEIRAITDRVAVIFNGKIIGEIDTPDADLEELGLMMMGTSAGENRL